MKDPVSPNQLFVEVQKDIVNLSVPQHTHVHHVEFCQPPNKKATSNSTREHVKSNKTRKFEKNKRDLQRQHFYAFNMCVKIEEL